MNGTRTWRSQLLLVAVALAFSACEESIPTQQVLDTGPAQLSVLSGDEQVAAVGSELDQPLVVSVRDGSGKPIPGQIVNFRVTEGDGSVFAGTGMTNGQGLAQERWTLGPVAGRQRVEVRAIDAETGEKQVFAQFFATALDPAELVVRLSIQPAEMTVVAGSPVQLSVSPVNGAGDLVEAADIAWSSSNSSIAEVTSAGLVTGKSAGTATIRASVHGEVGEATVAVVAAPAGVEGSASVDECSTPGEGWIFCDDFEADRTSRYFEFDQSDGDFARAGAVGVAGSMGMRARFDAGQVGAGSLKVAFGRTPSTYFRPVDGGTRDYQEIYWRFYVRNSPDWAGGGGRKLSRATSFANGSWAQSMIAHIWTGSSDSRANLLIADPASGTDAAGVLRTTRYNDFANLRWLGSRAGTTPLFDSAHVGEWFCVEARVRLNDAGQSNGVFQYWLNGELEAGRNDLNWVGSYSGYGVNSVILENYWDGGSPQAQERYFDNLVVSTQRIGCGADAPGAVASEPEFAPEPLLPPVDPAAIAIDESTVEVSWGRNSGVSATHYRVYRSATSGSTGALIAQPSETSFRDHQLSPSSTYYYAVTAVDAEGAESELSAEVSATTPDVEPVVERAGPFNPVAHFPAGYERIVNRDFNSKASSDADRGSGSFPDKQGGSEGWDGAEYSRERVSLVQDATAPVSPSNVFRFHYPAGFGGGRSPGIAQTQQFSSSVHERLRLKELYVSTAFKVSANWDGHRSNVNKLWFMRGPNNAPDPFALLYGSDNEPLRFAINLQGSLDHNRGNLFANTALAGATEVNTLQRGKWYAVEVQLIMNTPGRSDGILRVWLADPSGGGEAVLTHEYRDIRWSDDDSDWRYVQIAPVWGGVNDTLANAQDLYFDYMYVGGR